MSSTAGIKKSSSIMARYKTNKCILSSRLHKLAEQLARNELEWLQLCNAIQESRTKLEVKPILPLFKDAADINTVPLEVDELQVTIYSEPPGSEVESESNEEEEELS